MGRGCRDGYSFRLQPEGAKNSPYKQRTENVSSFSVLLTQNWPRAELSSTRVRCGRTLRPVSLTAREAGLLPTGQAGDFGFNSLRSSRTRTGQTLHHGYGIRISRQPVRQAGHRTQLGPGPRDAAPAPWSSGVRASRCTPLERDEGPRPAAGAVLPSSMLPFGPDVRGVMARYRAREVPRPSNDAIRLVVTVK
jgi:hypothetical protein